MSMLCIFLALAWKLMNVYWCSQSGFTLWLIGTVNGAMDWFPFGRLFLPNNRLLPLLKCYLHTAHYVTDLCKSCKCTTCTAHNQILLFLMKTFRSHEQDETSSSLKIEFNSKLDILIWNWYAQVKYCCAKKENVLALWKFSRIWRYHLLYSSLEVAFIYFSFADVFFKLIAKSNAHAFRKLTSISLFMLLFNY